MFVSGCGQTVSSVADPDSALSPSNLSVPTILYPTNGLITNESKPVLRWESTSNKKKIIYEIVIDQMAITLEGETEYLFQTGLTNGIHTFKVRARTESTQWGAYCSTNSFTVDTVSPSVVSVAPGNNDVLVPPSQTISAVFSESMEPSSFADKFVVSSSGGNVSGSVSYDASSKTVTFTPSSSLAYNTTYDVILSSEVRDVAGNIVGVSKNWQFTTRYIWVSQDNPSSSYLNKVFFLNATTGWAVGYNSTIMKSSNGGKDWDLLRSGTNVLYGIWFIDPTNGFAVGASGGILSTANGGVNWSQTLTSANTFKDIAFSGSKTGYIVGANGEIRKTIDGGASWQVQTSGVSQNLNSICLQGENLGLIAGEGGVILKTSNAGTTWTAKQSGTSDNLNSVYFIDSNTGWIVGDAGKILYTTNGGDSWTTQSTGTTTLLKSVNFIDKNKGWAVGDVGTILYTTDGGAHWNIQENDSIETLESVFFFGQGVGFVVGGNSILKYTP